MKSKPTTGRPGGPRVLITGAVVLWVSVHAGAASGPPRCDKQPPVTDGPHANLISRIWSSFTDDKNCDSIRAVLSLIDQRQVTGGRKLEANRPFDPAAAESELSQAQNDAELAPMLRRAAEGTDHTARLVREAALLHEYGYYKARDMRVKQLREVAP
jgi:hypothetical protein